MPIFQENLGLRVERRVREFHCGYYSRWGSTLPNLRWRRHVLEPAGTMTQMQEAMCKSLHTNGDPCRPVTSDIVFGRNPFPLSRDLPVWFPEALRDISTNQRKLIQYEGDIDPPSAYNDFMDLSYTSFEEWRVPWETISLVRCKIGTTSCLSRGFSRSESNFIQHS